MKNNPTWVRVTDCFVSPTPVQVFEIVQKKIVASSATAEQFQLAQLYTDNLTKLRNILEKDYPVQNVPPNADIDAAIDVFDRVNSLGTKLTDAELALTHITGKWAKARQDNESEDYRTWKQKDLPLISHLWFVAWSGLCMDAHFMRPFTRLVTTRYRQDGIN